MRNKLFDEHVKKQFDGYRPEVAPHIWEKIAAEQDRRKPAPFWLSLFSNKWMVAALCLVAATGAGLYLTRHNTNKAQQEQNIAVAEKNNTPVTGNNTGTTGNQPGNNANTIITTPSTGSNPAVDNNTDLVNDPTLNNNTNPGLNNGLSVQNNTVGNVNRNNGSERRNNMNNAAGAVRMDIGNSNAVVDIETAGTANYGYGIPFISGNVLSKETRAFGLLPTAKNNTTAKISLRKLPAIHGIPCPPAEKDAAGNKSYFEVYAGPDYVFRSFSDTANSAYLKERKATVSAGFSYSAGVRYTKVFKNGLSIRTGLNYSRINERFKYVKGNVTHNIYITNTAGDTTGTYVERGTQYQQSTNKYQSLDIPLVAGYELGNGKIHANVNAGVMVNILSRQKGYVLDPAGAPVDISTGKSNSVYSYKTNAGISFLGSFSVYYKLNDRFHLLAEPYLRYGLSAITKTDISLKQKNHTAGLRVGLRMDL
jgi:hypothetical protein